VKVTSCLFSETSVGPVRILCVSAAKCVTANKRTNHGSDKKGKVFWNVAPCSLFR
jgi:hypothetical protein